VREEMVSEFSGEQVEAKLKKREAKVKRK